ncbi:hypothetical protein VULLAG_LOCUS22958 [Vulpes lagopus]
MSIELVFMARLTRKKREDCNCSTVHVAIGIKGTTFEDKGLRGLVLTSLQCSKPGFTYVIKELGLSAGELVGKKAG